MAMLNNQRVFRNFIVYHCGSSLLPAKKRGKKPSFGLWDIPMFITFGHTQIAAGIQSERWQFASGKGGKYRKGSVWFSISKRMPCSFTHLTPFSQWLTYSSAVAFLQFSLICSQGANAPIKLVCEILLLFSSSSSGQVHQAPPAPSFRIRSDPPRSSKRAKVATANLQRPAWDDHHPMKCSNVSENHGGCRWIRWEEHHMKFMGTMAGRQGAFFFNVGWDSTIFSAGVMEYHGHCGKHIEESSCIPATLPSRGSQQIVKSSKSPGLLLTGLLLQVAILSKKNAKKNRKTKKKKLTKQKIQEYYVECNGIIWN